MNMKRVLNHRRVAVKNIASYGLDGKYIIIQNGGLASRTVAPLYLMTTTTPLLDTRITRQLSAVPIDYVRMYSP